uniref:CSON008067 protein n=1 Tax=Culicoides sonorensis TaxID=179676 RepID=A0A336MV53_CULSO
MYKLLGFVLTTFLITVLAQENAQTRIPKSLEECYRDRNIYERDNRLPMTINTLIELIKKIEDTPGLNMDIRELAVTLIHRFKQDGIEKAKNVEPSEYVLPYSPTGYQFNKHKILLENLLPGNALRFPNETLTMEEQCAMHFMLSTSIDKEIRGDEAMRCSSLAQYRTNRIPREAESDIELMTNFKETEKRKGELKEGTEYDDYDETERETPIDTSRTVDFGVEYDENAISQCPVENGVIRTKWGAVSAGPLLSGIAAGLQPQMVRSDLITVKARSAKPILRRSRRQTQRIVDNRWAATLSGDVSEAALLQGPNKKRDIQVGAKGAWNSTTLPRWYFLSQRDRFEMTDAEIRGGLDGLIIAKKIKQWNDQVSGLRLSQILDMYYSQRGIFSGDEKACKRKDLFEEVAPIAELKQQSTAFSSILDKTLSFVTLSDAAFEQFSNDASDSLYRYVPQSLNDPSCDATQRNVNDKSELRTVSDLFIFIDTQWAFTDIQPVIGDILQNIDLGFGTNYTLLSAHQAEILVNSSQNSFAMLQWNQTVHDRQTRGLNLPRVLEKLKELSGNVLDHEKSLNNLVGRSKIALIVPQMAGVSDAERNTALEQLDVLRDIAPDLRILFLANGSPTRFEQFVKDKKDDLFQLNIVSGVGNEIQTQTLPVINRIQELPRRLVNHKCGAQWDGDRGNNHNLNQFIEPNGVIYYKLSPNYFYRQQDNRKIRVQNMGYASLTVCHSRTNEFPRQNATNQDGQTCRNINMDTVQIDLPNPCDGQYYIRTCHPLYISVEYPQSAPTTNFRCSENACRSPDSAKFVIHGENLGCFSGAGQLFGSFILILMSLYTSLRFFY